MLNDAQPIQLAELAGEVLVYPDDSSGATFYCSSLVPRVARAGTGQYQISLLNYTRDGEAPRTILALVVDLALPPALRERLEALLRAHCGQAPLILPIPWTAGTAALGLLGGTPVTARPALLGNNAVLFQKTLSEAEFLVLQSAALDKMCVVYRLAFDVQRPRQDWVATMDWQRFRKLVQKKCELNLVFFDFSSEQTAEEIRSSGALSIEGKDYAGDGAFRRSLLNRLGQLFTPLPVFAPAAAPDAAGAWRIGYRCDELSDTQRLSSHARFDFNVVAGVRRAEVIQGVVADLAAALAARAISYVRLEPDPLMRSLSFVCMADMERDRIQLVRVLLKKRGGLVDRELQFTAAALAPQSVHIGVPAAAEGVASWAYEVVFHDSTARPALRSADLPLQAEAPHYVIARSLYALQEIPLFAQAHVWHYVRTVQVEVRAGAGGMVSLFELSQGQPLRSWELFGSPDVAGFSYRLSFHGPAGPLSDAWRNGRDKVCADLQRGSISLTVSDAVWRRCCSVQVRLSLDGALLAQQSVVLTPGLQDLDIAFGALDTGPRALKCLASFTPHPGEPQPAAVRHSAEVRAASGNVIVIAEPPASLL
jgi:hypothetical protein